MSNLEKYKKLFTTFDGFFLLFYLALFVIFSLVFTKECINHEPIITIFTSLIWIIASLGFIFSDWRKLFILESTQEKSDDRVFSEKMRSQDWLELIAIIIISIPIN